MKLAISNIAWEQHDDPIILELLRNYGISGIEVAPTKIWHNWENASYRLAHEYRVKMNALGFKLPVMQAILFAKPKLQIFDKTTHNEFLEHIKLIADIANGFGSTVLVFGSPKNRKRGQLSITEANDIATDFFYKAAEICLQQECCIALEHNPVEYGCDFITNVTDAEELVTSVNSNGFQLHLDSAGLHMCGGDIAEIIGKVKRFVHYHVSEPMLEPIVDGVVDQKLAIDKLKAINYNNWVSIEMKQPTSIKKLELSLQYVKSILL